MADASASWLPLLSRAWRAPPMRGVCPLFTHTDEVAKLVAGGVAPLVWKRIEKSPAARTRWGRLLRDHYYASVMEADKFTALLRYFVGHFHSAGITPILVKGWAVARLYREPALRPFSDIDLCVAPDRLAEAERVILQNPRHAVLDLHSGVADLADRSWTEIVRRSVRVSCHADTPLRILGPEDQLRQLCLHFWRHLGMKPIWLIDIACAMEAAGPRFEWDFLLHGDPVRTDWVRCTIGLAQHLLGAECPHVGLRRDAERLPGWLASAVLWRWQHSDKLPRARHYWRHPKAIPDALRYQWLNPLRATFRTHMAARRPSIVLQTLATLQRPVQVAARLTRSLRRAHATHDKGYDVHQDRIW
jgi:hypothetical protein